MAERARQHRAVDAAGRCPGDDIEIFDFGVEFLIALVELVDVVGPAEGGFGALGAVERSVQARGRAQELEDFLGNAVHVDGERNAAEADERDAKLFLAQERPSGFTPLGVDRRSWPENDYNGFARKR